MAKKITQETFDSVVKENVQEFDMSPADAMQDAIEQFKAQVILQNIIGNQWNCMIFLMAICSMR